MAEFLNRGLMIVGYWLDKAWWFRTLIWMVVFMATILAGSILLALYKYEIGTEVGIRLTGGTVILADKWQLSRWWTFMAALWIAPLHYWWHLCWKSLNKVTFFLVGLIAALLSGILLDLFDQHLATEIEFGLLPMIGVVIGSGLIIFVFGSKWFKNLSDARPFLMGVGSFAGFLIGLYYGIGAALALTAIYFPMAYIVYGMVKFVRAEVKNALPDPPAT